MVFVWSFFFNMLAFVSVSLLRPLEPIGKASNQYFYRGRSPQQLVPAFKPWRTSVPMDDLVATVSRYLGDGALAAFP